MRIKSFGVTLRIRAAIVLRVFAENSHFLRSMLRKDMSFFIPAPKVFANSGVRTFDYGCQQMAPLSLSCD